MTKRAREFINLVSDDDDEDDARYRAPPLPSLVVDQLREALPQEMLDVILDFSIMTGSPSSIMNIASLNRAYAGDIERRLGIIFANMVTAAADELRTAVKDGTYDGMRSMCTLPAVRALIRMRDKLRLKPERYMKHWPRAHAATSGRYSPRWFDLLPAAIAPRSLEVAEWLHGQRKGDLDFPGDWAAILRDGPESVPFYVLWHGVRSLCHSPMLHGSVVDILKQWIAHDWATCCVVLLSDSGDLVNGAIALSLILQRVVGLDPVANDEGITFREFIPKCGVYFSVPHPPFGFLISFYRGSPGPDLAGPAILDCPILDFRPFVSPPPGPGFRGFIGSAEWRPGQFLDELSTEGLAPGSGLGGDSKGTIFPTYAVTLGVFVRLDVFKEKEGRLCSPEIFCFDPLDNNSIYANFWGDPLDATPLSPFLQKIKESCKGLLADLPSI